LWSDEKMKIGREMQIIDCRETAGMGLGGGLAQAGTFAEAEVADVIVLSMGPTRRHITKPVCEITYGIRERNVQVSVLVLRSGIGPPHRRIPRWFLYNGKCLFYNGGRRGADDEA
jgi:Methyl coenzyme M reductase, subunit C